VFQAAAPAAIGELAAGQVALRELNHGARRDRVEHLLRGLRRGVPVPDEQDVVVSGEFVIEAPDVAARVVALQAGVDIEDDDPG
jgi:hypothetical protein